MRRLAWALWALAVALAAVALAFLAINGGTVHANTIGSPLFDIGFRIGLLAFPTVGALIVAHRPGNAIGWVLCASGIGSPLEDALLGYATHALVVAPGSLPGGAVAAVVADAVWAPTIIVSVTLLFLLFPTGRLLSSRWALVVGGVAVVALGYVAGTLLTPGPLSYYPAVANPLGVDGIGGTGRAVVDGAGVAWVPVLIVAVASLVLRFRRAERDVGQQLKWLVLVGAVFVLALPVLIVTGEREVRVVGVLISELIFALFIVTLPLAVGVAILRHRLYDVDLVINRTLVYGALTVILASSYLAMVLLLGLALGRGSSLTVAVSTLAVAALFRPARARIQALVDRRFYRGRYDAARTLETFGARLRHEVDLDAMTGVLRAVTHDTLQPRHVSLWLREGAT